MTVLFQPSARSVSTVSLDGRTFGLLLVESFAGYYYAPCGQRYPVWHCACRCGQKKAIRGGDLLSGRTVSCGCHKNSNTGKRRRTHGESHKTKEYVAWCGMLQRCYDQKGAAWKNYGGRGIQVCPAWRNSFANFLRDIGRAPSASYTLDRINNDGNYEPGNVQWATRQQQVDNRRAARLITFRGETMTISAWARRLGVKTSSLFRRFNHNWSPEEALTTPFRYGQRLHRRT